MSEAFEKDGTKVVDRAVCDAHSQSSEEGLHGQRFEKTLMKALVELQVASRDMRLRAAAAALTPRTHWP